MRRGLALLVVLVAVLSGAASAATPSPTTTALGDSITRGFNAGLVPFRDAPSYSWATGTDVSSAAQRLQSRAVFNDAKDGARMRDLPAQAARAAAQGADRVLILMGANDICHGDVAAMTSTARFRSDFESALRVFATRLPDARIEVMSIPDLYGLWQIESDRLLARTAWRFLHLCDALLSARAVDSAGGPRAPVARAHPAGELQPDPGRGLRGVRPLRLRRRSRVQDEIRASGRLVPRLLPPLEVRAAEARGRRVADGPQGTRSRAMKNPDVRWTCGSVRRNSGRRGCRKAGHSVPSGSGSRPEASTTSSFSAALIAQTE